MSPEPDGDGAYEPDSDGGRPGETTGGAFRLPGPVEIIAHRGFSARAPENTLSALRLAVLAGADAVEFDLQVTADDVPVLFHDDDLSRTTDGRGAVSATPWTRIRRLDAGRWFDPRFAGERVPTLSRALEELAGWPGRIYAELKSFDPPEGVDRVADAVAAAGLDERTVFIAMRWVLLDRVRARYPDALIGYVVRRPGATEEALTRAAGDPRALIDFRRNLPVRDRAATERALALGIPMAAWTVDDPDQAATLLAVGVRRITTNEVARLVDWKRTLSG